MKKRLLMISALALACVLGLTGCTKAQERGPIPEGVDETALVEAGREVLDQLIAGEYQEVRDRFREDIRADVTVEDVAAIIDPVLAEVGTFQSVEETDAYGDEEDEPLAAVDFLCSFSQEQARFRVVFDDDLVLTGLAVGAESSGGWSLSNIGDNITGFFGG